MKEKLAHLAQGEQNGILSFRDKLLSSFPERIKRVVLFGSKARGDDLPESDIDVLVIVDLRDRELWEQIIYLAHDLNYESDFLFHLSPVVMSEEEFNRLLKHERRFALDALEEGILL